MEPGEPPWTGAAAALAETITIPFVQCCASNPSYTEHGSQKETALFGRWEIISMVLFFCLLK